MTQATRDARDWINLWGHSVLRGWNLRVMQSGKATPQWAQPCFMTNAVVAFAPPFGIMVGIW